jgi:abortive infection bacteriophage resistance protein
MYIETAVKNIALICILDETKSESIQDMYDKAVENYNTDPSLPERKRHEKQENKLSLQSTVQSYLFSFYRSNNPNITHFYNNMSYSGVPVWALFEVLNMGDFGKLLSCLTYDVRDAITQELGLNTSADTNRELVYRYIYCLKELRNAIAHNDVIFDSRFKKSNPSPAMKMCIIQEIGLPHINFDTIDDYIILVSYYLKLLEVQNTEIIAFIQSFESIVDEYKKLVCPQVSAAVIHPNLNNRINILKNFI